MLSSRDDALAAECRTVAAAAGVELVVVAPGRGAPAGAVLVLVDREAADGLDGAWPFAAPDASSAARSAAPAGTPPGATSGEPRPGASLPGASRPGVPPDVVLVELGPSTAHPASEAGWAAVCELPQGREWLARRMAGAVEEASPPGRVVGVVGGCGGAGASVLAAGLAWTAADVGAEVVAVDADPLGGGIDLLLGVQDGDGLRWGDLAAVRGPLQPGLLTGLLPRAPGAGRGVAVLAHERPGPLPVVDPAACTAVLASARAQADLVVVDLPRTLVPAGAAQAAAARCDVVLVVVPAHVRAAAAAVGVVAGVSTVVADVRVVVRRVRGGLPSAAVADAMLAPLAAVVRSEPGLASALARGEPPALHPRGPLRRSCAGLLVDLLRPDVTRWAS